MTVSKETKSEAAKKRRAAGFAKRAARAEMKTKAKVEANKTKMVLIPLQNRVQALIQEYEEAATFEHARRMEKLLHGLLRAISIGIQEAEKDLAKISEGENPCQPSALRQRLEDLLWDSQ